MASISRRWTLSCEDEGFPASLEDLSEPPELIHGIGSAEALSGPCISIIGARRATPYGLAVAEMAARVAVECGITVVSGGAMGCDHAAGLAAIRHGGKTVIVSGCGADVIYPASSGDLYEGAVATGGAVISTEQWGRGPRRWSFPRRNRLIAALSLATVVTEAGIARNEPAHRRGRPRHSRRAVARHVDRTRLRGRTSVVNGAQTIGWAAHVGARGLALATGRAVGTDQRGRPDRHEDAHRL